MANYKIEEIEGIGPVYGEKLRQAGVKSTEEILKRACDRKGRQELAEATGLDASLILTWVNMADLFRVKGIGAEYAELLKKSGVDTVKELRNRNPENLLAKMTEINSAGRQLVRALPSLKMVESWVTLAKELDPMVTH
jgi:predicted flap endonuclease-1-like 5' DNA nuclease